MKLTPKIATAAAAVIAIGGAGIGTAAASSASTAAPTVARAAQSEPTGPDHDAIQQGDQTSPDTKTSGARSEKPREPRESASESESGAASDGPGGHADPAGNVQHEFNGVE
jgi:hypothetical protein